MHYDMGTDAVQVVLTSSLEDASFGLWGGIKFFNWAAQV